MAEKGSYIKSVRQDASQILKLIEHYEQWSSYNEEYNLWKEATKGYTSEKSLETTVTEDKTCSQNLAGQKVHTEVFSFDFCV